MPPGSPGAVGIGDLRISFGRWRSMEGRLVGRLLFAVWGGGLLSDNQVIEESFKRFEAYPFIEVFTQQYG